ncbi:MAG: TIR domain-containing protein, partial [Lachnospiraceae bacterium]|nr:TIR domain-containing protein [Lachnospiraceae bacterium]
MKCEVFISYHTKTSLHIVESIVNKLEAIGIRCWYAPRNTVGPYAGSITTAINNCRIFLLILNGPASQSFDVLNEIKIACNRFRNNENIIILPFHIAGEESQLHPEAIYYLSRQHWIDAMTPPMYKRIEELVNKIQVLLGDGESASAKQEQNTSPEPELKLMNRMPQVREIFEGRQELIENIHNTFSSGKTAIFLEGIGGIGKSELAKQYAVAYRNFYDTVVFATYQDSLCSILCNDEIVHIENLRPRESDEQPHAYFERKLKALRSLGSERILLIIDGFDVDQDADLPSLLEGNYRVLITTRNAHPGFTSINVDAISDENVLLQIFEKNYGSSLDSDDRKLLPEIFQMIEHHTYTVELVAKQMAASFLSAAEMLQLLRERQINEEIIEKVEGRNSRNSLFGHLCSLFNMSDLGEEEKQILRVVSLTGNNGIPAKRLKEWAGLPSFEIVNQLISRSWLRRETGSRLSMHPLVCEVVCSLLTPTEENVADFLNNVAAFCVGAWWRPYRENLEAADAIEAITFYFSNPHGENYAVFDSCYSFLWQVGRFDSAIHYAHIVYDATCAYYGKASIESGYVARSLAGCYFNSQRKQESIPYYKVALQNMLDAKVEENEDLAICYEKVARCYTWEYEQDFEKAESLFQTSLRIRQNLVDKFLNGDHPVMLNKYESYDLAKAYGRLGECYME